MSVGAEELVVEPRRRAIADGRVAAWRARADGSYQQNAAPGTPEASKEPGGRPVRASDPTDFSREDPYYVRWTDNRRYWRSRYTFLAGSKSLHFSRGV